MDQLFVDFKKTYDSFSRGGVFLYNILVDLSIHKELVRLIKMCLSENYNTVRVGKLLSDMFQIRNGLK